MVQKYQSVQDIVALTSDTVTTTVATPPYHWATDAASNGDRHDLELVRMELTYASSTLTRQPPPPELLHSRKAETVPHPARSSCPPPADVLMGG